MAAWRHDIFGQEYWQGGHDAGGHFNAQAFSLAISSKTKLVGIYGTTKSYKGKMQQIQIQFQYIQYPLRYECVDLRKKRGRIFSIF